MEPVAVVETVFPSLKRGQLTTLQVNLGYRCNQSCAHCHVNAGPTRTEMMNADLLALIPQILERHSISCLDLTGGAPELHPGFRALVRQARSRGTTVIDRCNLTILSEPGQDDLAEFLAEQGVCITASLPCYSAENVDQQRGDGVFERSISGLRQLNALGYGTGDSNRQLDLVYNPLGPVLPPPQQALEADYKKVLGGLGIRFDRLLTLANMPIQRFAKQLERSGDLQRYQTLLEDAHNPANLGAVMCRQLISVDWQGHLYDCDFNQQLNLASDSGPRTLVDLLSAADGLKDLPIAVADHCFGCTAGNGSSCGGSLS